MVHSRSNNQRGKRARRQSSQTNINTLQCTSEIFPRTFTILTSCNSSKVVATRFSTPRWFAKRTQFLSVRKGLASCNSRLWKKLSGASRKWITLRFMARRSIWVLFRQASMTKPTSSFAIYPLISANRTSGNTFRSTVKSSLLNSKNSPTASQKASALSSSSRRKVPRNALSAPTSLSFAERKSRLPTTKTRRSATVITFTSKTCPKVRTTSSLSRCFQNSARFNQLASSATRETNLLGKVSCVSMSVELLRKLLIPWTKRKWKTDRF